MSDQTIPRRLTAAAALTLALYGCGGETSHTDSTGSTAPSSEAAPNGNAIPLKTDIPAEAIVGTPVPIEVPNLETPPTTAPTLAVPDGTQLLSAGKPVTASDDLPIIGDLSYITDGDKHGDEGYFVELIDRLQWVQIDLEQEAQIEAVWVWHYHGQARAYHDVIVQVSNDPEFNSGITTLFNNDYDNSSGIGKGTDRPYVDTRFGKLIDGDGTSARYVRLYSNGNTSNDMNHYIEVEVFGTPN